MNQPVPRLTERRPIAKVSLPPIDLRETGLMGCILFDPDDALGTFRRVAAVLPGSAIVDARNAVLYGAMAALAAEGKPPVAPLIASYLGPERIERAGGAQYIGTLQFEPAVVDPVAVAQELASAARQRRIVTLLEDATASAKERVSDLGAWVGGVAAQLTAVAGAEPEQTKASRIHLLDAHDIFAQLPPIPWVVRGLDMCPGAPTLFAGYGYSGKSIVLQAMTLQIAAGLPVWRSFTAQQGGCVHFDYEQGEHLTRLRYQRLAWAADITPHDLDDRLQLVCFPPFYLDEPEAEGILSEVCQGKVLAVFDSFRAACRSTEENSSEARVPLDMLGRVSERTGCAMAVIHHARKVTADASGGARDSIRGSSALYDACGSVFVLEGQPDEPDRTMHHVKARVSGKTQEPMTIRIEDDGETGPDGSAAGLSVSASKAPTMDERLKAGAKARDEKTKEELREMFRQERHQSNVAAIASKIGRAKAAASHALQLLIADGEVVESGTTKTRGYDYVGK